MSDFSPATRNGSMWSGDSRRIAQGKANEVILTKTGQMEIPDLSHIEAVQMGHVMEPVIGRLAANKLQVELHKIEDAITHPKESWLKSHFDFVGKENGETFLVECKNYNAAVRNKFSEGVIPPADLAQCIHEALVYGCSTTSTESLKTASQSVEMACNTLASIKTQIKVIEAQEEQLQTLIQGYMEDKGTLVTVDNKVLATWKNAKASMKFDSKLFQQSMPDIYEQFVRPIPGSRRFLVKS